jgi:hypothetical protein
MVESRPSYGIVDQSRQLPTTISVGDTWQFTGADLELEPAEHEPSLGSLDGEMNQERWAAGDRLYRERGEGVPTADSDGGEEDQTLEPEVEGAFFLSAAIVRAAGDGHPAARSLPWARAARLGGCAWKLNRVAFLASSSHRRNPSYWGSRLS